MSAAPIATLRAARAVHGRAAASVEPEPVHCCGCGPDPEAFGLTHGYCAECEEVMDAASDYEMLCKAASKHGRARSEVWKTGDYDKADRAFTRFCRLLRKALDRKDADMGRASR